MKEYAEESWAATVGNAMVAGVAAVVVRGLKAIARQPLNSLGVSILGIGTVLGCANALWLQPAHHPSPLFMETAAIAETPVHTSDVQLFPVPLDGADVARSAPSVVSALPAPRLHMETRQVPTVPVTAAVIGNKDVAALQLKLGEMNLFTGKVDGYYGPATANAIRAFEQQNGMTPKGAITSEILQAVQAAAMTPSSVAAPALNSAPISAPIPAPRHVTAVVAPNTVTPAKPEKVEVLDNIAKIALSAMPDETPAVKPAIAPVLDPMLVKKVQTGLVRLGFLNTEIDGKFDAQTARAIREFENYNNFTRTGEISLELVDLLQDANAFE